MLSKIKKLLPASLEKKLPRKIKTVSISQKTSRRVNRKFRKVDRPADVLSFRYGSDYGEILICPAKIRQEAKAQGHSYKYQMTWMILHGILHLAELHHEVSEEAEHMVEAIERQILSRVFN